MIDKHINDLKYLFIQIYHIIHKFKLKYVINQNVLFFMILSIIKFQYYDL